MDDEATQPYGIPSDSESQKPLTQDFQAYNQTPPASFRPCDFLDDETLSFINENQDFIDRFQVYRWRSQHPGETPTDPSKRHLLKKYSHIGPDGLQFPSLSSKKHR